MSGLLASEFRRFRSRRLVKALVALELLAIVATGVIVLFTQEYDLHLATMRLPALRAEARLHGQPAAVSASHIWGCG
jgi:hypothetical protein